MELSDDFLKDCRLRGRTNRTIEGYRSAIREFLEYFPEPERVGKEELKEYLGKLQERDLKGRTIKSYFSAVSSFYEYLIYEEKVQANPMLPFRARYLDKPAKHERRQLLSVKQMRELINSIPPEEIRDIAMLVVLAKTGARRNEFINILAEDVDFKRAILRLPEASKRNNRYIPMDNELFIVLETYMEWRKTRVKPGCKYLWITHRGHHFNEEDINRMIAYYAEPLGLHRPGGPLEKRLTCHCFRKFFTHHLTKNGMTELFVQILRGDSLKDAAWKDNYIEPEDMINEEIRYMYSDTAPQLICY